MSVISMKQLLEAGVHFGHQTRRWNPKMAPYIYTERNGIYIIDLQKSVGKVDEAYKAIFDIAAEGGNILFVGTKKQAQDAVATEAQRCGMYYVNQRWLGGMLTNFKTIQSRIARLRQIETMSEDGTFDVLPKKEVIELKKEWEKLEKNLGGIKDMPGIPDAIFVVDPKKEKICVQEAHTLGIPLIGIADTNCDPEELDYVIPGNDDAIRAVKLIASKMADAVIEAKQGEAEEVDEVAEASGIPELKKTTRDEPDYDKLMKWRLGVLKEHGLGLKEIQDVIRTIDPLPGAKEFLDELRSFTQVILISDTFTQFASPLMEKLGWPTLFCNSLEVAENGEITGFKMRVEQSKLTTVKALQSIGFDTIASGDSYNDLGMIQASKAGFLFRSTDKIKADYPDIPAYETYEELLSAIRKAMVD